MPSYFKYVFMERQCAGRKINITKTRIDSITCRCIRRSGYRRCLYQGIEMEFKIESTNCLNFSDAELAELLKEVYVGEGYVDPEQAETMFEAAAIRSRGKVITACNVMQQSLAGLVIMVPPTSNARKLAKADEVEVHLLAVKKDYRNNDLGNKLVSELILQAQCEGYKKIILWTQKSMITAQNLYSKLGFVQESNFKANGRDFYLYTRLL
jgi:ribosomal protein S18 acetylase RimI-like enzyme